MDADEEIKQLLREIRDAQQRAVAQQEQLSRLHRWLVRVGGGLVAVLLAVVVFLVLIYFLLAGWSRYLFGV